MKPSLTVSSQWAMIREGQAVVGEDFNPQTRTSRIVPIREKNDVRLGRTRVIVGKRNTPRLPTSGDVGRYASAVFIKPVLIGKPPLVYLVARGKVDIQV